MITVVAIRHVHFEHLGLLASILAARGARLRLLEAGIDDLSPARDADLLVILGGPISANATGEYPFLFTEIQIAQARLAEARPTLGICLGAQIMARALGAPVYPASRPEIGWAPVECLGGAGGVLAPLGAAPVLHWHGETFDLPAGAVHLARTPACPTQAFALGAHGLGLQFHLEAGRHGIEPWLIGHAAEIGATPGVSVHDLRRDTARFGARLAGPATAVFNRWIDGWAGPREQGEGEQIP